MNSLNHLFAALFDVGTLTIMFMKIPLENGAYLFYFNCVLLFSCCIFLLFLPVIPVDSECDFQDMLTILARCCWCCICKKDLCSMKHAEGNVKAQAYRVG
ncbi:unnamed protein product, partial [Vitis vinifera]